MSRGMSYMARRPPGDGPLFVFESGLPLSRSGLVNAVRVALSPSGLDLSRFNGHSFRIGAATTPAAAGIPDFLITLGRWKSAAFLSYIRTSPDQLAAVSRTLAGVHSAMSSALNSH